MNLQGKTYSLTGARVYVTGHTGMLGSAICRRLESEDIATLLTCTSEEVDLTRQDQTEAWMQQHVPDLVIHAAGTVGGIHDNSRRPSEFLYENMMMAMNIIATSVGLDVPRLLFLGSSCVYPVQAEQPMKESAILTGPLEETNQWYAIAKIAGLKLCEALHQQYFMSYIAATPCNLYGPRDTFDGQAHVIPMLIKKFHQAKVDQEPNVVVWGSGFARREFLYVDDCADALIHLVKYYYEQQHINVGYGEDISILELATMIAHVVGYEGDIVLDPNAPEGALQKMTDSSKLFDSGWKPETALLDGLKKTYAWFL